MLHYIRPVCLSRFYLFQYYEIDYFNEEPETIEDFNSLENFTIAEEYHYDFMSKIKNKKTEDINLVGEIAYVRASRQAIADFKDRKNYRVYNPLEDTPELYTEMAKLNPFNEKELLKFVGEYGIPKEIIIANSPEELYGISDPINIVNLEMDVIVFSEELEEFKEVFHLWSAIQQNDKPILQLAKHKFEKAAIEAQIDAKQNIYKGHFDYLEEIIDEELEAYEDNPEFDDLFNKRFNERIDNEITYSHSLLDEWHSVKDKGLEEIAKSYLLNLLNAQVANNYSIELQNNEFVPGIRFNDLLEVAYFQLSKAVLNNAEYRRCLNCDAVFEITHEGRKFCPPLPGRKRSTCENTYNQRLKRQRKRQKERGSK